MPALNKDELQGLPQPPRSLMMEFMGFLTRNKKFWLLPLLIMLLLLVVLLLQAPAPSEPGI